MLQNAPREHSAILSTFIKLPFVFKIFVLSILEWTFKTGNYYSPGNMNHSIKNSVQLAIAANLYSLL